MTEKDMRAVIKGIFNGNIFDWDEEYRTIWEIIEGLFDAIDENLVSGGYDTLKLAAIGYIKARKVVERHYNNVIKFSYSSDSELRPTYEILKAYKDLALDYYLKELGVTI